MLLRGLLRGLVPVLDPAWLWRCFLPEANHDTTGLSNPQNGAPETPAVVEFNWPLYVYKKRLQKEHDYRYTIAVWRGKSLVSICLLQPLEIATKALSAILRDAGTPGPERGIEWNGSAEPTVIDSPLNSSISGLNGDDRR